LFFWLLVGSYDPEILGFSSQLDAHCLHIKQDAHRLLYPNEGCISIQHYGHSDFLSSINALKAPQDIAEWQAIVGWLWSIFKDPETKQETELMVCLLNEYLDEDESSHKGSLGNGLKTKLCDYLTKSFEPDLGFIAGHAFVSVLSLQKTTSTMVEIENSALRRRPDGIKRCHHIAETKKRLSTHGKQKDRAKKQRTLQSLDRIPSQVPAREVVVDNELCSKMV
jgi:hypothetical protein